MASVILTFSYSHTGKFVSYAEVQHKIRYTNLRKISRHAGRPVADTQ